MANNKTNKNKEMSEGKAIAITVLLITGGIIALVYAVQFLFTSLFPGW